MQQNNIVWMELTVGGQQKNQSLKEAEQYYGAVSPPFKFPSKIAGGGTNEKIYQRTSY